VTDSNVFDNLSALIDSMTDSLTRGQDRLESNQADVYSKLEKLRADLYALGTAEAISAERVNALAERIERITDKISSGDKLSAATIEKLMARIELVEKWVAIQKQRQLDAADRETKEYRKKITAFLSKGAALLGAGAAGGGLAKLLASLFGG